LHTLVKVQNPKIGQFKQELSIFVPTDEGDGVIFQMICKQCCNT